MKYQSWTPGDDGDNATQIKAVIDDTFTDLCMRDASGYGFLTTATAAVNVAAMQSALDVGGIITINTPGS